MDNRPLKFEEWDLMRTQTVFVSATPGPWELKQTKNEFIDQIIRPTGLIDPPVEIRQAKKLKLMISCTRPEILLKGLQSFSDYLNKKNGRGFN